MTGELTRQGLLIEEQGEHYLGGEADPALAPLQVASCTYRIAMGPRAGHKVLSLQSIAGSSAPAPMRWVRFAQARFPDRH